ncbi:MAG: MgtC/SapB family protein [Holophagales bacterium]|nr:MgtC/SapB family protein [Holophagales bacterium]MBK9966603.1 MgtC/SapB family protein [Holophagales bacterium]
MGSGLDLASHAGEPVLLLRLLFAALAGAAIGWNRFRNGKPAGVGTHALVALGSALFVAIPVQTSLPLGGDSLSRVIQGVATGVGFLGAGEIFRDPGGTGRVHGLTSAAALWVTAALGIVAVCGSWVIISATTAFIMLILVLAPRLERRFAPRPGEDLR